MFKRLTLELDSYIKRDPAARNRLEVFLFYPGCHAVLYHRLAHWLWQKKWCFLARFISQASRFFTGIEIHPGAQIGEHLFIDHGMGVVIGETAVIGNNVTLYHGVTLGGISLKKERRHPTLEDDVVVGAGAKILGPITVGKGARIGSNAVVTSDVESSITMVGVPARRAKKKADKEQFDAYGTTGDDDPTKRELKTLMEKVAALEAAAKKVPVKKTPTKKKASTK